MSRKQTIVPDALKKKVDAKIAECLKVMDAHYKVKMWRPTVAYDLKGTVAGMANYKTRHIRLNPDLMIANWDDFINVTVPHELAHIACEQLYPEAHNPKIDWVERDLALRAGRRVKLPKREIHGKRWKSIMAVLGADDSRCHNYDVAPARRMKAGSVLMQCDKCNNQYSMGKKRFAAWKLNPKAFWCKCSKTSYLSVVGNSVRTPAPVKASRPVKVATKKQRAVELYDAMMSANPLASRAAIIDAFIRELEMTKAGASTYYYACVNGR